MRLPDFVWHWPDQEGISGISSHLYWTNRNLCSGQCHEGVFNITHVHWFLMYPFMLSCEVQPRSGCLFWAEFTSRAAYLMKSVRRNSTSDIFCCLEWLQCLAGSYLHEVKLITHQCMRLSTCKFTREHGGEQTLWKGEGKNFMWIHKITSWRLCTWSCSCSGTGCGSNLCETVTRWTPKIWSEGFIWGSPWLGVCT